MYRIVFFLNLIVLLSSCSDGDSANNENNSVEASWPPAALNESPDAFGYIVDSEVEGLRFKSGGHYGVTDLEGKFGYIEGQKIQFFVGDIPLGNEVEPSNRLSPYELAGLDATVAMNIAQFLQTIDNDSLPTNGITINESVHILAEGIELDFSGSGWVENPLSVDRSIEEEIVFELTSATEAGSRYLVPRSDAYSHFAGTLDVIIDELEVTIIDIAGQSSCVTSDQCKLFELRSNYGGLCSPSGSEFSYSQLDIDLRSFDNSVDERNYLIEARAEMRETSILESHTLVTCFISISPSFPVCNDQQRCEIRHEFEQSGV